MKKFLLIALLVPVTAIIFSSCAAITSKVATKENIEKLPEPLKSQVKELVRQQNLMNAKFTSGTRKMFEAYRTIMEAIGEKELAFKLKAVADSLDRPDADARVIVSKNQSLLKEVRSKISASNSKHAVSKETFTKGIRTKDEAYMIEYQLGVEAGVQALKGIAAMKSASPIQKVMLTATLDPLFFFARDIPKFQAQEREFDEQCRKFAEVKGIKLPPSKLPTPKPANLPAF